MAISACSQLAIGHKVFSQIAPGLHPIAALSYTAVTKSEISEKADTALSVEVLAASCVTGTCPTVFATNRGTILVQGYTVSSEAASAAGVTLPEGEQLVEIPAELLAQALGATARG
ncbi:hypothetical protein AB0F81_04025 [Actinoplanes sp. NPDC024001]|uniref:hypothetical protein n=1 Tax=Actinoplanes sp. NPDC024001 TaxID=3154598 RepID=UPI0033DFD178